jgi:hypothetical protein
LLACEEARGHFGLEDSCALIKIRLWAFKNKVISTCPDGPTNQHGYLQGERLSNSLKDFLYKLCYDSVVPLKLERPKIDGQMYRQHIVEKRASEKHMTSSFHLSRVTNLSKSNQA